jgi:aryl-alcohol dehydrogenase-like predicted oxidoreductase
MKKQSIQIGLGTAAIGRPHYINVRQTPGSKGTLESFITNGRTVLDEAYQQGIRYFDTAPGYGLAEQLLIDWVEDKQYKDVEIATKWGYTYVANFDPKATIHEVKEHSLEKINEQWLQSKKLLPYLSSYQIHSATLESGVLENKEVLDRLYQLKSEFGLLIGLTTSGANQNEVIKKALDVKRNGESLFDVFQVTYNVLDQNLALIADDLFSQNKRIVVKEALANGRLFTNPKFPEYNNLYSELEKLAIKYKVGVDAIALRFCVDSINPFKVLSGASEKNHLSENLKTETFELEESEILRLNFFAISPEEYWQERKELSWN